MESGAGGKPLPPGSTRREKLHQMPPLIQGIPSHPFVLVIVIQREEFRAMLPEEWFQGTISKAHGPIVAYLTLTQGVVR